MIKYKVVNNTNDSAVMSGGKYSLHYKVGTIVTAREETLGVMVFDTHHNALKFLGQRGQPNPPFKIIKVKPIGRGVRIKTVSLWSSEAGLLNYYKHHNSPSIAYLSAPAPPGTICYKSVEVISQ